MEIPTARRTTHPPDRLTAQPPYKTTDITVLGSPDPALLTAITW
jgi:hypothetical protein